VVGGTRQNTARPYKTRAVSSQDPNYSLENTFPGMFIIWCQYQTDQYHILVSFSKAAIRAYVSEYRKGRGRNMVEEEYTMS
jgi:hypothetical protein